MATTTPPATTVSKLVGASSYLALINPNSPVREARTYYDDVDAPDQMATWHPKLKISSETPTDHYKYALPRSPQSPQSFLSSAYCSPPSTSFYSPQSPSNLTYYHSPPSPHLSAHSPQPASSFWNSLSKSEVNQSVPADFFKIENLASKGKLRKPNL